MVARGYVPHPQLPWSLLDYYELVEVLRSQTTAGREVGGEGAREDERREEVREKERKKSEEVKGEALRMVTKLGDSALHKFNLRCQRIARLTSSKHF